ncbi:RNA polymerase sigma factor SigJ [Streptomyces venezuelae]|uniref:RNA polymerase sigma factor SigJ n=1 Tax=Streptomyces venezuelae TaxID=54571 RepID=UPI003454732D
MSMQPDAGGALFPAEPGAVLRERPRLINLAYRFLGSLADAEDVVQETYVRWYAMSAQQQAAIVSPGGWLTKVASRICLDLLGSARARREKYVGEWLPEPLPDRAEWGGGRAEASGDPADRVTLDESVGMAFLVVLEAMTPAERVAFILHDVFRYPFGDIAEIVGRSPAACRQLAASARRRVGAHRPEGADKSRRAGVVGDFKQAWESQDIKALIGLLDPDVTVVSDGGGLVHTRLQPVEGSELVAQSLLLISARAPGAQILQRSVNGQPGLVVQHEGVVLSVLAFDIGEDRIQRIWAVRNPEKLRPWAS